MKKYKKRVKRVKGVNPLIATILLLLISLAIAGLLYSWLSGYTVEKTNQATQESEKQFTCSNAGFRILKCDYTKGSPGQVLIKLESTGDIDLNSFTIFVEYNDNNIGRFTEKDKNLYARGRLAWTTTGLDSNAVISSVKIVPGTCPEVSQTTKNCD